ncbi:17925_t:CDS:1, partial [Gigaspora rosea]
MRQQKRRSKVELHAYIENVINDYEKWIECLKNLNKFDSAVKEQELKEAFVTEKNKYDEIIK